MTDQELIKEIRTGTISSSQNAMRQIYKTCFPMTESMILKNNGNSADAQDIFQDAMVIVYNKIKEADFILESKLSTYTYAVSRNLLLKHLRDNKKSYSNLDVNELEIDSFERVDEALEFTEQQTILGELLMKSGQKCLDILKAFYFEKLKIKKIAELQNYSSGQIVRTQKMRCIKKIRALIQSNNEYDELKIFR